EHHSLEFRSVDAAFVYHEGDDDRTSSVAEASSVKTCCWYERFPGGEILLRWSLARRRRLLIRCTYHCSIVRSRQRRPAVLPAIASIA
ncbi:MAG: hypothetical protein J2P48_05770, partial [Alphaproteobacteria bacterium]|nr:hypothetical protein [Alphaproteobacteria bacterium]